MYKVLYVVAKRFCPDPLETYFYKQQPLGAWKDKLLLYGFSYAKTFQNQKVFKTKTTGKAIKKKVLFPEIGRVKILLSLTRPHSRMCSRIYIFNFKNEQTNKQKSKNKKNPKETKEEKRISPENRLKK